MAKYAPLATYLRRQRRAEVILTFRDIERIISGLLPKAAATERWWKAERGAPVTPQQLALADAGFLAEPHLRAETVRFIRDGGPHGVSIECGDRPVLDGRPISTERTAVREGEEAGRLSGRAAQGAPTD
ncbi:toxin-antitoxin system, antitoxin component [Brevundimonas aurantiaca]|uniref:toxin-antitoxin system, antitoxin component n=1 Tax=Brevundimonas aurantiaca TaxID=74316 RepID=UPI0016020F2F